MNKDLQEAIIRNYGEQCVPHIAVIEERVAAMLAALLYAGTQGDNPLCVLNRAFENLSPKGE